MFSWWPKDRTGSSTATVTQTAPPLRSRCPRCQQVEAIKVATLTQGVIEDGKVTEETVGYRYACQHCECVYSFGRNGAFYHGARSQPLTPEVPITYDEAPEPPAPTRPAPPVPLRRARV